MSNLIIDENNNNLIINENKENADKEFVRDNYYKLIETSNVAIEECSKLAMESQHPRAFEVLEKLIRGNGDLNRQLIDIHGTNSKSDKNIINGEMTQNNIFVGTTKELNELIEKSIREDG